MADAFYKISEYAARGNLSATHCNDNFDFVTLGQKSLREHASRHNLTVALDCNAFTSEVQSSNQIGDANRVLEYLWRTIDTD
jgi:hypothetical protein